MWAHGWPSIESVTKLVATGFRYEDAYLTFQEYFERLGTVPGALGQAAGRSAGRTGRADGPRHRLHRR